MNHYADSSFLVSCYVPDTNTAKAKTWLSHTGTPLIFTALHTLEVRNAFKLGVFRGLFSAADAATTWGNLEKDLRSGRLIKTAVNWPVAFRIATQLSERHSAVIGTRSLDVLLRRREDVGCSGVTVFRHSPANAGCGGWFEHITMKLNYYADTDSLYIDLSERPSTESREISEGVVLDYDSAGNLVGIDIDNASLKVDLKKLTLSKLPGIVQTDSA